MSRQSEKEFPNSFDVRMNVRGDRGQWMRMIVEAKKLADKRKTNNDTIEAIILEYGDTHPKLLKKK